uniref:Uncharacterized protein n=1 Tax=Setaria italica TaxID=4555 RepID=K3YP61_SETIT
MQSPINPKPQHHLSAHGQHPPPRQIRPAAHNSSQKLAIPPGGLRFRPAAHDSGQQLANPATPLPPPIARDYGQKLQCLRQSLLLAA